MNRIVADYDRTRPKRRRIRGDEPERYALIGQRDSHAGASLRALRKARSSAPIIGSELATPFAKRASKSLFADGWAAVVFLGGLMAIGLIAAFAGIR